MIHDGAHQRHHRCCLMAMRPYGRLRLKAELAGVDHYDWENDAELGMLRHDPNPLGSPRVCSPPRKATIPSLVARRGIASSRCPALPPRAARVLLSRSTALLCQRVSAV